MAGLGHIASYPGKKMKHSVNQRKWIYWKSIVGQPVEYAQDKWDMFSSSEGRLAQLEYKSKSAKLDPIQFNTNFLHMFKYH